MLIPGDRDRLMYQVEETTRSVAEAKEIADKLAFDLSVPTPQSLAEVASLAKVAKRAAEAPSMDGVAVKLETWTTNEPQIRAVIKAGGGLLESRPSNPL